MNKTTRQHPNFSQSDYDTLNGKGYSDREIRAIWDLDRERGQTEPLVRKPVPDVVGTFRKGASTR